MTEVEEKAVLEMLCNKKQGCKECFCNDLCMFLFMKTGVATSCEDFRIRVAKLDREVDSEKEKLKNKLG